MSKRTIEKLVLVSVVLVCLFFLLPSGQAQKQAPTFSPQISKIWDEEAFHSMDIPLVGLGQAPTQLPAEYYYKIPIGKIFKTYPVYAPGREPAGYFEWLKQQEPVEAFHPEQLKTEDDWVKAGELIFTNPVFISARKTEAYRNLQFYEKAQAPIAADGTVPFVRYVIREKGKVETGDQVCGFCHTRVLDDGRIAIGAQGKTPILPIAQALASFAPAPTTPPATASVASAQENAKANLLARNTLPWLTTNPTDELNKLTLAEINGRIERVPGIFARPGTEFWPTKTPDLIGLKERKYLDATGVSRHRSIEDFMRYVATIEPLPSLLQYASFGKYGTFLPPPDPLSKTRFSEEMLYALGLYVYSLKPPENPNKPSALTRRGEQIFQKEGCANCHTPPLYTNNKLIPADVIGTDPRLAMQTRKATGFYKVPSLKGVWYRGPFEHNGSISTLEEWFDPARLQKDYVPTGYKGFGVKTRAITGHEFGLKLSAEDKKALIAFLKTL
jgi:hypothetical protein